MGSARTSPSLLSPPPPSLPLPHLPPPLLVGLGTGQAYMYSELVSRIAGGTAPSVAFASGALPSQIGFNFAAAFHSSSPRRVRFNMHSIETGSVFGARISHATK